MPTQDQLLDASNSISAPTSLSDRDVSSAEKLTRPHIDFKQELTFLGSPAIDTLRLGWAARLAVTSQLKVERSNQARQWRNGDLIAARVIKPGQHKAIITADNRRMRLYRDDLIVGVLGERYASDAFESVIQQNSPLHLVTASGMCSTVTCRHESTSAPTELESIGLVSDPSGPVNLIDRNFTTRKWFGKANVILMMGSGMNAGKTTTSRRLVKALLRAGHRVAACKVTGSVSHRDLYEYWSTGAHDVRDFSSYGFPSTYGCSLQQLRDLFETMVADASAVQPDVIVMEVADGILQPESWAMLQDPVIAQQVRGIVYACPCSLSAIEGTKRIQGTGHEVLAVSGIICNSPLMVREFQAHCEVPVLDSSGQAHELVDRIVGVLSL